MILCVCPSPAIDVTYHVERLRHGSTTRVQRVAERPGGKAVNVARVLHRLGEPVRLALPVGGDTGAELRHGLDTAGLEATYVANGHPTRRTVTVVEAGTGAATSLVEPAALDCWPELLATVASSVVRAQVLVVSGSIPAGVPEDGVAELVGLGLRQGVPVVVDTHGPSLLAALEAGAHVVKPNADELAALTGDPDPERAARDLAAAHGCVVVASLGERGLLLAGPGGCWEARAAAPLSGNPTGAGDALVAGLARHLRRDPRTLDRPEEALRDAVALSAAAVLSPEAGEADLTAHAALRDGVLVRTLDGAR